MAQAPSNLNKPTPNMPVTDKSGIIHKDLWAWFAALGAVASWAVTGALTAATATIAGLLTAGSLLLTTAVTFPAGFAGRLYAGDAAWTAVGFINGWGNLGGGTEATQFRRASDGLVTVVVNVTKAPAADNTVAFVLPVGYRPLGRLFVTATNGGGTACSLTVDANGNVSPNISGVGLGVNVVTLITFYAEA